MAKCSENQPLGNANPENDKLIHTTVYIRGGSISPLPISIQYRYLSPKILAILNPYRYPLLYILYCLLIHFINVSNAVNDHQCYLYNGLSLN